MTLTEFLLARIQEDEGVARKAGADTSLTWEALFGSVSAGVEDEDTWGEVIVYDEGCPSKAEAAHIARWDPARVLAECEAKRKIVALHGPYYNDPADFSYPVPEVTCSWCEDTAYPCPNLRLLALPYADHTDYEAEEWKP